MENYFVTNFIANVAKMCWLVFLSIL